MPVSIPVRPPVSKELALLPVRPAAPNPIRHRPKSVDHLTPVSALPGEIENGQSKHPRDITRRAARQGGQRKSLTGSECAVRLGQEPMTGKNLDPAAAARMSQSRHNIHRRQPGADDDHLPFATRLQDRVRIPGVRDIPGITQTNRPSFISRLEEAVPHGTYHGVHFYARCAFRKQKIAPVAAFQAADISVVDDQPRKLRSLD